MQLNIVPTVSSLGSDSDSEGSDGNCLLNFLIVYRERVANAVCS